MTQSKHVIVSAVGSAAGAATAFGVARVLSSLPPEHPFYCIIGRVAAEGARLEHTLDLIIWELAGVDHKLGSCITGQLAGAYGRFNAIQALAAAKGWDKETLKRIETLANETNNVLKARHRFVHDAWYTEGGEHASQFKSFAAKDGRFGIYDVTESEALDTVERIRKKTAEVAELRSKLQTEPSSS